MFKESSLDATGAESRIGEEFTQPHHYRNSVGPRVRLCRDDAAARVSWIRGESGFRCSSAIARMEFAVRYRGVRSNQLSRFDEVPECLFNHCRSLTPSEKPL